MKYAFIVIYIIIFILCATSFCGAEKKQKIEKPAAETAIEKDDSAKLKHIDTGEDDGQVHEAEYGVNKPELMPPGQSYDENTGLPNIVESDAGGEIE
ncbi:MAG: hypothetical protein Q8N91_07190 [Candidatus Omnitrophota bacterium]|nr:hypothetical protein [Candidatus Omnitrophota bacterium]